MKRNSLAVLVMFAEVEKIDNYIFFLAEQIRLAVQRIVVTVNGKLDDESVRKLSSCADDIFIRENKGFASESTKTLWRITLDGRKSGNTTS